LRKREQQNLESLLFARQKDAKSPNGTSAALLLKLAQEKPVNSVHPVDYFEQWRQDLQNATTARKRRRE
jgi:hypothetical protein